jgi:hypothetical protein
LFSDHGSHLHLQLGVAAAGNITIQTMLIGALGCNLAWGIVDGGLYLLAPQPAGRQERPCAIRRAPDAEAAQRVVADALPPELASVLPAEQLELFGKSAAVARARGPKLTRRDWTERWVFAC